MVPARLLAAIVLHHFLVIALAGAHSKCASPALQALQLCSAMPQCAVCACAAILSDQIAGITLFAPPNDAINATLEKFGLDFEGLLKNTHLCTQIMQYHILPSPIEVRGSPYIPPC